MGMLDKFMTVEEVAEYLGYKKQTVYNMVHNSQIPFHKIGLKSVRFKKEEIDQWIKKQKEREVSKSFWVKKNDKYYLQTNSEIDDWDMKTESEFLDKVQEITSYHWNSLSVKETKILNRIDLHFRKEDRENAKKIIKAGLVYPGIIRKKTYIYEEASEVPLMESYLTLLKLFSGKMGFNVVFSIKKRVAENVREEFIFRDSDEQNKDSVGWGVFIKTEENDLLNELRNVCEYLALGSKGEEKYLPYANRYFNHLTFLSLYLNGFCYFVHDPYQDNLNFFLKDKAIDQLTPDQIAFGLENKILVWDEVRDQIEDRIERTEKDLKDVRKIAKAWKLKK